MLSSIITCKNRSVQHAYKKTLCFVQNHVSIIQFCTALHCYRHALRDPVVQRVADRVEAGGVEHDGLHAHQRRPRARGEPRPRAPGGLRVEHGGEGGGAAAVQLYPLDQARVQAVRQTEAEPSCLLSRFA